MRRNLLTMLLPWITVLMAQAIGQQPAQVIQPGAKYFIYNTYYDRYLCTRSDRQGYAGLSRWGVNDSTDYVFTVIASNTDGYYWLQQESTGRFLQASNADGDTWNVWLVDSKRDDYDSFKWQLSPGDEGRLSCRRSPGKYLGVDTGQDAQTYIGVYYDKPANERSVWQFMAADDDSKQGTMNRYGKYERYVDSIAVDELVLDSAIDYHVAGRQPMGPQTRICLNHEDAWLIMENVRPSVVVDQWLSHITIQGEAAEHGRNCRVVIYLDGAVVIPQNQTRYLPFVGYSEKAQQGQSYNFFTGKTSLGNTDEANNRISSFLLKRGYMVTLATTNDGTGYSRVFVADHQDLVVDLPTALCRRVSYVNVKRWNYTSKKGWASTEGQTALNTEGGLVRATWFYTWSADKKNQLDMEYVPMNTHQYWPSVSTIAGITDATHMLGLNEPEHPEQHKDCSCNGTTSAWTATTLTPRYQTTGMRIGSPCPTDASWVKEYIGHVDDMAYRCDFVTFHAYWGTNEAADVQSWYNQLKAIYDATKRPIWLTEWNNGASWTTESKPSYAKNAEKIKEILEMLENADFIERYDIYNWDDWHLAVMSWDSNKNNWWVTPAGEAYRDVKPHFAYRADMQKVPNWWGFGIKTAADELALGRLSWNNNARTGKLPLTNANIDQTDVLWLQYQTATGEWKDFREVSERELFDNTTFNITLDAQNSALAEAYADNPEQLVLRLSIVDIKGNTATSAAATFNWPSWIAELAAIGTVTMGADSNHHNLYDAQGRRLQTPVRGLNIENHRKYIKK